MNLLEKIIDVITSEFDCASNQALVARVDALEKQVAELLDQPSRAMMVITIGVPVQK